jgi:hypothetical protein
MWFSNTRGYGSELASAAHSGDEDGFRAVLASTSLPPKGCATAEELSAALMVAAGDGHAGMLEALLAHGQADPGLDSSRCLTQAVCRGHEGIVRTLLADGRADPAAANSAALHEASIRDRPGIVQALLVDGRADPAAVSSQALSLAARCGLAEVVRLLLADGRADPRVPQVFYGACLGGHVEVARLLLKDGRAHPTAALMVSVFNDCGDELVQLLLADDRADPRPFERDTSLRPTTRLLLQCAARWRGRRSWLRASAKII